MKIAVDAMGGDYAPAEVVAGAVEWCRDTLNKVILVGQQDRLNDELKNYDYDSSLLSIVNAGQIIGMDESPALALRKKKDASILVATRLVKEGLADAVLSCGSTGAQMAAALFILGRMEGVERPPIGVFIPNQAGGTTLLMDAGANVDCKASHLVQFAALGGSYLSAVQGLDNPRIALLSNGEEAGKGNSVSIEAYELLQKQESLNFMGNIEGRDLFSAKSDVIICDGFTGNILLKSIEGLVMFVAHLIKQESGSVPGVFGKLDYTQVGGAPLMGVKGVSVVCHGSSRRNSVYNGISIASDCIKNNIVQKQQDIIKNLI
ncbi:MAG: phosphate acyltransferase PlsX [Syntrophomonadaceae bacterium]|jgi:glycerol-3-phosphate acyltransferase PlsX|nr:phosphate acyltransferase PlsX [Syntrophomonadaceae bacterium]